MKSRMILGTLFVLSIVIGTNVNAKEITVNEINKYVEKVQNQVPVQIESKANLVQYKMKDTGVKLELEQENIKVEIPKNIAEPVVLKGKEQANTKAGKKAEDIKITMPQAKGSKVTKEKSGVVGYESKDNFTNIVEPTKDGIRLMTVIENKNAPERYEYKLDIKGGYFLTESYNQDGKKGIAVLNADQSDLIAMIDAPWAKDGSGKDIETYYEIKGNTIVQVVKHKVKGTVYPVSADPYVWGSYYEQYWWGQVIWWHKSHSRKIANWLNYGSWASGGFAGSLCSGNVWQKGVCGAIGGLIGGSMGRWADGVVSKGSCIGTTQRAAIGFWFWEWNNQHCVEK